MFQWNWIRSRHERERNATVAIFVFSYFRAFVIDSISSHHNSFHDKHRGVEVEEQADAEPRCAEIGPHRGEVHVLQGFDGFELHDNLPINEQVELMSPTSTPSK